ncbi:MAG: alcohol dehydrogenase [Candidatus Eremiobacteraeota bacterium]|nr:alcohol dehydrogenase [Candidatus Eremiobacteraeota bacterium]
MQAVVVDRSAPGGLVLADVADPVPLPFEALVRVAAVSLNLGEIRRSKNLADGWRPGWDFAGIVERAAADGSGPHAGSRVVGMLGEGAWAERVAAPTRNLAIVPAAVDLKVAATLPIAGLTALYALGKRGSLLGRRVLVTGASGGVGMFATQLARLAGAHVTALVHRPEKRAAVAAHADVVVVGASAGVAHETGPFDVILESVGGDVFASALRELAEDGMLVTFGTSAERTSTIDVASFYAHGGVTIYGFIIFHELERESAGAGLARLAALLDAGKLTVHIDGVVPIAQIGEAAERLWSRRVTGKLVATFPSGG